MSIMLKKFAPAAYAYFLRLFLLLVGIPLILGSFFYTWFWNGTDVFNKIKFGAMRSTGLGISEANLVPSPLLKVLAITVDGISVVLLFFGCVYFIKLLGFYSKGEFFSKKILIFYKKLVWIAFLWTLYNPLKFTALSLITTINNPVGQRILSVGFQSEDLFHIFIVGSLLIVNALMQEAYKLKQEQDFTV